MAAALGGLDALVFTGGVGEHAPRCGRGRRRGSAFLGVASTTRATATARGDAEIGADGARVRTLVIAAREDLEIARQVGPGWRRAVRPAGRAAAGVPPSLASGSRP